MKYLLMLALVITSTSAFADKCQVTAVRQAQSILSKHIRKIDAGTGVFLGARVDRSSLYISNNEGGYTNMSVEGRLLYRNKKYNSRINDLMVRMAVDENCRVRNSEVLEISAE